MNRLEFGAINSPGKCPLNKKPGVATKPRKHDASRMKCFEADEIRAFAREFGCTMQEARDILGAAN